MQSKSSTVRAAVLVASLLSLVPSLARAQAETAANPDSSFSLRLAEADWVSETSDPFRPGEPQVQGTSGSGPWRFGAQLLMGAAGIAGSALIGLTTGALASRSSCGGCGSAIGLMTGLFVYPVLTPVLIYAGGEIAGGDGKLWAAIVGSLVLNIAGVAMSFAGLSADDNLFVAGLIVASAGPLVGSIVGYEISNAGSGTRAEHPTLQVTPSASTNHLGGAVTVSF